MDAIEYLKEFDRMCKSQPNCKRCPFNYRNNGTETLCLDFLMQNPEKAVDIVEKWSKEHSVKTIKDDFLEKHPNARMMPGGVPVSCARNIGYEIGSRYYDCPDNKSCEQCWNTPL